MTMNETYNPNASVDALRIRAEIEQTSGQHQTADTFTLWIDYEGTEQWLTTMKRTRR